MKPLDAALDRGDQATAWRLAGLPTFEAISLDYALALLLLVCGDAGRYERGAQRWLQRWATEHPNTPPAQLAALTATLDELPGLEGVTALAGLCETLNLPRAAATLIHLYPGTSRRPPRAPVPLRG